MSNYWKDRQIESQNNYTNKSAKEVNKQMMKYYQTAMKSVIKEFENTYLHLMNTVGAGHEPTPADLYKLDKYWEMQAELTQKLQKLGDKEVNLLSQKFIEEYRGIYNALALQDELGFNKIDDKVAKQVINSIWCADGKSWSERVWSNTAKLQAALNETLVECVITGKQATELKQKLMADFNVDYNRANTLVRTEMAHIQTAAAQQRYKDTGVEQVQIWGDEDERRCDICGQLHKKIYSIYEPVPIPAHPNCRCCIVPVVKKRK